jgi:hypothetical protein
MIYTIPQKLYFQVCEEEGEKVNMGTAKCLF